MFVLNSIGAFVTFRHSLKVILFRFQILAKHVMNVHMNALQTSADQREGEIDLQTLKKFIGYCRRYNIRLKSAYFIQMLLHSLWIFSGTISPAS